MRTHDNPAVAAGLSVDPGSWLEQFDELMGPIAGRFARVEPRRRARAFVLGLLSDFAAQELLDDRRAGRGRDAATC